VTLCLPDETELADGFGEGACDLLYVSYRRSQKKHKEVSPGPEIPLLLIAYQHGRVDICFDRDKNEPIWHSNSVSHSSPACKMIRSSRSRVQILPRLAVFESVDLGIATIFRSSGRGLQELNETWIPFQVDPLYPNTVYVYHCLGLQSLQMGTWLDAITEVMEKDPQNQDAMAAGLEGVSPTAIEWVVDTFTEMERCVYCHLNDTRKAHIFVVLESQSQDYRSPTTSGSTT
jgi:nucleoporin NUP82